MNPSNRQMPQGRPQPQAPAGAPLPAGAPASARPAPLKSALGQPQAPAGAAVPTPAKTAPVKPSPAAPGPAKTAAKAPAGRPLPSAARPVPGAASRPLPTAAKIAPPPPTPGEIAAGGTALIACIDVLVAVLEEETAAVRAHDRRKMAALQDNKSKAVGRYEQQLQVMRKLIDASGGSVDGPDAMKLRMKEAAGKLDKAVAKNVLALRAAKDANERLMTMIQTAAAQSRPTGQGYTASGSVNRGYTRNMPPAMSLNGTF